MSDGRGDPSSWRPGRPAFDRTQLRQSGGEPCARCRDVGWLGAVELDDGLVCDRCLTLAEQLAHLASLGLPVRCTMPDVPGIA